MLADQTRTTAVPLANHGLLAFGPDPATTADTVIAIEETAQAELTAAAIGGGVDLPAGASDPSGPPSTTHSIGSRSPD